METNIEKVAYGSNLTVLSFDGNGKIPVLYGGHILVTELLEDLLTENSYNLRTEEEITSITIKVENSDSTSQRTYTFPLETGQILNGNDYIDSDGLHINGNTIAFTSRQATAYQTLQNIPLYEGITHIIVTDVTPVVLKLSYTSTEEDGNKIYVLNKNEQLLAIFDKDDEDTLINPRIEKRQNAESVFTFTIDTKNPKWEEINNPENLYLVDGMIFSTNFDGSFTEKISENDEKIIEVTAYERQQLLSRKFVRAWNSETNLSKIDTFMVVILSNGNLPLKNDGITLTTRYPKGSSGYVLEGLLYGTGWTVGTCDIFEYENGEVVKDQNDNPVYAKFDFETDQMNIYDNILKVQELWGGILVFDSMNKIVHHRNETIYLPYNGYEVKYQKNMQSLEKKYNNKIITKLCPLGEGGLNIKNVNNNSVWLENYSYTNTVLEGIENNPDITDSTQLKKWGERKLEMLCRPSIELDVNVALLHQLEGYELETVDLNDIVDVINYNDVDTDYIQLRVIEFSYSLWDKSDAIIKLSNITLDSTDIFRQTITATNSINAGTLEAAKVVTLYKAGQSVEQGMLEMDGKVEFTYSELTRTDTGIIARVTRTENEYNTLSGVVGNHTESIASLEITTGTIEATVANNNTKANIIAQINDNTSQAKINADVVDISANDVLNILSGNTINLGSKIITLLSTNFSVDPTGNITAKSGTIGGWIINGNDGIYYGMNTSTPNSNTPSGIYLRIGEIITNLKGTGYAKYSSFYSEYYYYEDTRHATLSSDGLNLYSHVVGGVTGPSSVTAYANNTPKMIFDHNGLVSKATNKEGSYYGLYQNGDLYIKDIIDNRGSYLPEIECGSENITPSAANTPTGKVVTFTYKFSGTPTVVVTANTSVPGTIVTGVGVGSRSSTSCTIYITRTNTTETGINWTAMYR